MSDLQQRINNLRDRGEKHLATAKNYPHINAAKSAEKVGNNVVRASNILQKLYKELNNKD